MHHKTSAIRGETCLDSSIFTAEARAILLTLEMAQRSSSNHFLFLSDSLSCLQSMRNRDMSRSLVAEVLCCIHEMLVSGARLVFMWVPIHVGRAGNSAADTAAKAALLMSVSNLTLPYSDYFPLIRTHVLNQWQSSWSLETENKLHAIEPTVNITKSYRLPRRDEIIIHRLRIGHTILTHRHLLKRDSPPQYSACLKLNSQLNTYYCIVRRGMKSVLIILPSQTC